MKGLEQGSKVMDLVNDSEMAPSAGPAVEEMEVSESTNPRPLTSTSRLKCISKSAPIIACETFST